MNKDTQIKVLFKQIFGGDFTSLDQQYLKSIPRRGIDDKCYSCGNDCSSFTNRQDLPYFNNLDKVKTVVIAESPGSGVDKGCMGYVFGWENFGVNAKGVIKHYQNYFFDILNLNPEEVYITDAVKCYTHKKEYSKVFQNCSNYLNQELEILKPKTVIAISKQPHLLKFLRERKDSLDYELIILPHPSKQNFGKIPTVSEIFKKIGQLNNNDKLIKLGEDIQEEYKKMTTYK